MFLAPKDMRYVQFLKQVHREVLFDWYLEVGCRTGRTFEEVRGKTIAVDPFFKVERNVIGAKPAFLAFQQTSDAFFDSKLLKTLKVKLSFSFLDGMHLMEYLLRDFINTERHTAPGGVIAMHDCVPFREDMTTRDVDAAPQDAWTGDVWKLIPILQQYRPDLQITVLGCRPTGLVLVSNLDPKSRVLFKKYDKILAEWQLKELSEYGVERFFDSFEFTSARDMISEGLKLFDGVRLDPKAASTPEFVSP